MNRREFIAFFGGAAAWPVIAHAQQATMPLIGFLSGLSQVSTAHLVAAFREGLKGTGFVEGQNVAIEYRWAEGHYDRLPALAADLVRHQPAVLVAMGGPNAGRAAKAATATIPIVFATGDAVREGLAQSLNKPGGNATGVASAQFEVESKRLGLLRDLVPKAQSIAVLLNPTSEAFDTQLHDIQEAASKVALQINVLRASTEPDVETAFANMVQIHPDALLVAADPYLNNLTDQITALAARHAIPGIYATPQFAKAGGLASYGVSIAGVYHQVGIYTGRILKGANPADLPIELPTKFEFVINLKTAKALGLNVPIGLLNAADEVIE